MNGKTFIHTLNDVIHDAINSLLSIPRFDTGVGSVAFAKDACTLKSKKGNTIETGIQKNRPYILNTIPILPETIYIGQEDKLTWEEVHKHFGHISYGGIK